jgi:hypothetical protein
VGPPAGTICTFTVFPADRATLEGLVQVVLLPPEMVHALALADPFTITVKV